MSLMPLVTAVTCAVVAGVLLLRCRRVPRTFFDGSALDGGVSRYLGAREAAFDDLRPGAGKQVVWHGAPEARTEWAVVYIHGFSAASQETRPLPDRVAAELGANLYLARLQGHGRSGAAMAEATFPGWMEDMAEALAIGRRIGRRVLVLGCSTGATLAALALAQPMGREVAGAVLLSPNFGPKDGRSRMLTWPGMRWLLPRLIGPERGFEPRSPGHAQAWTTRYPVGALIPMAQAVRAGRRLNMPLPALFVFDPGDGVVDHAHSHRIATRLGAEVQEVSLGPEDDPMRHIIAGDILSPGMTETVTAAVVGWARRP